MEKRNQWGIIRLETNKEVEIVEESLDRKTAEKLVYEYNISEFNNSDVFYTLVFGKVMEA